MTDKPWVHPELKRGEVLLINVRHSEDWENNLPDFIVSVRRGNVAYTTGGKVVVPNMKPLFGVLKQNKKPKNYRIETSCGDWFENVAQKAKEIAVRGSEINTYDAFTVEFDFNGVLCLVDKDTNLEWLNRDYCNAHLMEWKKVGPDCREVYESLVLIELQKRKAAQEEQQRLSEIAYRAKDAENKRRFEATIKGVKFLVVKKKKYDQWKKTNENDGTGYGAMIFAYAEGWAKVMQKEFQERNIENPDVATMIAHAENCSKLLDFYGITGFMYGAAVAILAQHWKYGEALRKWHNKEWGHENTEGTVNPAMFVLNIPD